MGRLDRRCRAAAAPGARLPGSASDTAVTRAIGRRPVGSRLAGQPWTRGAAALSAAAIVGVGGLSLSRPSLPNGRASQAAAHPARLAAAHGIPMPMEPAGARAGGTAAPTGAAVAAAGSASQAGFQSATSRAQSRSFRRIILPDLLIVAPKGLTRRDTARLARIAGVRNMIAFDGAQITAGGRSVSAIGVDPATFRSWVPLRTASDQPFWTALSRGEFVAADSVARRLRLLPGSSYQLTGSISEAIRFGSAARLGLQGIDLLVSQAMSRRLGLVHQVAALISAPGVSMTRLTRAVSAVLGPSARMESLRSQQLPLSTATGNLPTTYLELFKESAARYCHGLSWTVLAAIGQIESADGTNMGPSSAGALGPMQFLPSTWARWGITGFGQKGPPNVMNPYDAVPSAARLLCADGAAAGGQSLYRAIFDYNHADWYVREVLALAAQYAASY